VNENSKVDFFEVVARKKLGVGEGWRWCKSEAIGEPPNHEFLIEGGVPKTLKSGPNKGKTSWKGVPLLKCVVTRLDLEKARAQYEATTRTCWQCQGSKQTIASSSRTDGNTYRECTRCGGTGEATL